MHLGFDRSAYPGDAVMQSLWEATSMAYVGVYLAPAPSHADVAWVGKVPLLREMGWGFLPVYVGQQALGGPGSHTLIPEQGVRDAREAAVLAATARFPRGSVIYIEIEQGGLLSGAFLDYVAEWVDEVDGNTDYWAGVYCSFVDTAAQVTAQVGAIPAWVFRVRDGGPSTVDLAQEQPPDPAESGFPSAVAWQYRLSLSGAIDLTWVDDAGSHTLHQVDLDSSQLPDPSIRMEDALRDAKEC